MSNSSAYEAIDPEVESCTIQSILLPVLLAVSEILPGLPVEYNGIVHTLISIGKSMFRSFRGRETNDVDVDLRV